MMFAEKQMLFGLLALQNNFVTREQLVMAFTKWTLDKNRSLEDIWREAGVLTDETVKLLSALVEWHVAQHDNDPVTSLAAISSVESGKAALQQLGDPGLDATLAHVAPERRFQDEVTVAPPATRGSAAPKTKSSFAGRFRILRPHAKGGLGEVFLAHDEELNRDVALKEIQTHFADEPNSRARFLLEAEITGGLEHPGIVPVYGLGTYADGRPYYAMRFIRGDNLKAAIDRYHQSSPHAPREDSAASRAKSWFRFPLAEREGYIGARNLQLRELLGRFIDVCQAIEYAHSRRVLHRDLKPGNIMLGKYGETLVVDWGLAKPQGSGPADNQEQQEATLQPRHSGDSPDACVWPSGGFGWTIGCSTRLQPRAAD